VLATRLRSSVLQPEQYGAEQGWIR